VFIVGYGVVYRYLLTTVLLVSTVRSTFVQFETQKEEGGRAPFWWGIPERNPEVAGTLLLSKLASDMKMGVA
jgi:hypothetical protein